MLVIEICDNEKKERKFAALHLLKHLHLFIFYARLCEARSSREKGEAKRSGRVNEGLRSLTVQETPRRFYKRLFMRT